jgi:uncharacterized protein (TIGR02265 family)
VDDRTALYDEVCRHSDLAERLSLLPPAARVRGLYFGALEAHLMRAGRIDRYRSLFPERFAAVLWHPMREFLVRLTAASALTTGLDRIPEGMFEIGRKNAEVFVESLLGRVLLRILSREPKKVLQQGVAGRRQSVEGGHWALTFPEERTAVMTMTEEYLYIESFLLGAAQGTFDAIGVPVRTEVMLTDRFSGQHVLRW